MKTELYTNKSVSACIKAAYTLFTSDFKAILKRLWLPALVNAGLLTMLFLLYLPNKTFNEIGLAHPMTTWALIIGCYALTAASGIWLTASIATLLNGERLRQNILKASALTGIHLVVLTISACTASLAPSFLANLLHPSLFASPENSIIAGYIITAIMLLLLSIFSLPFMFAFMRYQIDHKTKLTEVFGAGYKTGIRHWGQLFATGFIALLLTLVACFIAFIPLLITTLAQTFNQLGMLNGDPDGVPTHFIYLLIVTCLITMFMLCFIGVWMFFVSYYTYGSIEARRRAPRL